jgi:hypothetical protein
MFMKYTLNSASYCDDKNVDPKIMNELILYCVSSLGRKLVFTSFGTFLKVCKKIKGYYGWKCKKNQPTLLNLFGCATFSRDSIPF